MTKPQRLWAIAIRIISLAILINVLGVIGGFCDADIKFCFSVAQVVLLVPVL